MLNQEGTRFRILSGNTIQIDPSTIPAMIDPEDKQDPEFVKLMRCMREPEEEEYQIAGKTFPWYKRGKEWRIGTNVVINYGAKNQRVIIKEQDRAHLDKNRLLKYMYVDMVLSGMLGE